MKACKKYLSLLLCCMIVLSSMITGNMVVQAEGTGNAFYVSTEGDDANDGSLDKPFRTIQKAVDVMQPGDTCYVRGGVYHEEVKPAKSGTEGSPITITNYEDEEVVVSGCKQITGWTKDENKEGVWKASMPWTLGEDGCENQVFIDGNIAWEARYPNIQEGDTMTNFTRATTKSGTGFVAGTNKEKSQLVDSDLKVFTDPHAFDGATIWDVPGAAWTALTSKVETYDPETGTLTYTSTLRGKNKSYYQPGAGSSYFVFGSYGLLDAENEWWYDEEKKELYVKTPGGVNPDESGLYVEAKEYSNAFDLSDCSYVNIEGIDVRGATVITNESSSHIQLKNMHMEYVGHNSTLVLNSLTDNSCVQDDLGVLLKGTFIEVNSCEVAYSSGPLINVQGSDNTVYNCYIHDGNYIGSYCGHTKLSGRRQFISNNTMTDSGRDTVSFRDLAESVVQYNDISGSARLTKDVGIMYAANTDGQNTLIHHNYIHDSYNPNVTNDMGLYPDEMTHNLIIFNNVIWNIKDKALQLNQPSLYNLVYNNTGFNKSSVADGYNGSFADSTGRQWINNYCSGKGDNNYNVQGTWNYNNNAPAEAGFADPANGQFMISSDSALAGVGIPVSGVTGDVPSIGAYEPGEAEFVVGHDFENPPEIIPAPDVTEFEYRNLIKNGGFEYGTLEKWDGSGEVVFEDSWHSTNKTAATCFYGLVMQPGQSITQSVAVQPNTTYTLAFNSRSNAGSEVRFGVKGLAAGDQLDTQNNTSANWSGSTKDYLEFTTGPNDYTVVVSIANVGENEMFVDDIGMQKKVQLIGDLSQEVTSAFDAEAGKAEVTFGELEEGHSYYYTVSDEAETSFVKGGFAVDKPEAYSTELHSGDQIPVISMQYINIVEVVGGQVVGSDSIRVAEVNNLTKPAINDGFVRDGTYANQVMNQITDPEATSHVEGNTQYQINLNKSGSTNYNRVGYMQFDLSDLDSDLIDSAILRFYVYQTNPDEGAQPGEGMNRTVEVKGVASEDWDEDTITWNSALTGNAPLAPVEKIGSVSGIRCIVEPNGQFFEVDVTEYIRKKAAEGDKATLQLSVPAIYNKGNIYIATKEHPGYSEDYSGEFAPQLKIGYYKMADLEKLAEEFKEFENIGQGNYTDESWAVFEEARNVVKGMLDNPRTTQGQADAAMAKLRAAYTALVVAVDKTELQALFDELSVLENDGYTAESWKLLELALTNAETVLQDEFAAQETVDAAVELLTAARDALQKEPVTDKTALQALFDELSALENDGYTDESWAVLQQALADAKVVLDNAEATQAEVDAAKVALYEARCALEKEAPEVDKAVLQVLFDQLSVLENNGYTDESWAALQQALADAKVVLDNAEATQEEVDAAEIALITARESLEKVLADKTALQALFDELNALENDGYTAQSWDVFQQALVNAKAVLDHAEATQEVVDAAKDVLDAAYRALEKEPVVDKTALMALFREMVALENNGYTDASWEALQQAIADAATVLNDTEATQEMVDAAEANLNSAYQALEKKPVVDKTALEELFREMVALENNGYTDASWEALQQAIADAATVLNDAEATQEAVDAAKAALTAAYDALEKEPVEPVQPDKTALQALFDELSVLENDGYTAESWDALQKALTDAKAVLDDTEATQETVDAAKAALEAARDALEKEEPVDPEKPDKSALQKLYDECQKLKAEDYTKDSWKVLADAMEQAKQILTDEDATAEQIASSVKDLEAAKSQLKKAESVKPVDPEEKPENPSGNVTTGEDSVLPYVAVLFTSLVCMAALVVTGLIKRRAHR